MIQKGKLMMQTYVSKGRLGKIVEKQLFPVGDNTKKRNPRKKGNTPPRKQAANLIRAERILTRLINNNFQPGDWHTVLTLKDMMDPAEVKHQAQLFLQRIARHLKKEEKELKYIMVISDMDGESGDDVRPHVHIIMTKVDVDLLSDQWKLGTVDVTSLKHQQDYSALATYLLKQVRKQPDAKKYTPSRNLVRPAPKEEFVKSNREINVPKGATLLYRAEYSKDSNLQYVRYFVPYKEGEGPDADDRQRIPRVHKQARTGQAAATTKPAAGSKAKAQKHSKRG